MLVTAAVQRLTAGLFVVEEKGAHDLRGLLEPAEYAPLLAPLVEISLPPERALPSRPTSCVTAVTAKAVDVGSVMLSLDLQVNEPSCGTGLLPLSVGNNCVVQDRLG